MRFVVAKRVNCVIRMEGDINDFLASIPGIKAPQRSFVEALSSSSSKEAAKSEPLQLFPQEKMILTSEFNKRCKMFMRNLYSKRTTISA